MTDHSEKRSEVRLPIDSDLTITILDDNSTISAKSKNMSGSGILLESDHGIAEQTKINISLSAEKAAFNTDGEVVRLVEADDAFMIGVKLSR